MKVETNERSCFPRVLFDVLVVLERKIAKNYAVPSS